MPMILPAINSQVLIEGTFKTLKQLKFYFIALAFPGW